MMQQQMKIYTALAPAGYERCHPVDPADFDTIRVQLDGQPRIATWRPLGMKLLRHDESQLLTRSDAPWLGDDALMFRPTAILALGSLLRGHGELLPLQCDDAEIWMFNPPSVDALDEDTSAIARFSHGGIMDIIRPAFRPDAIRGIPAFKIPNVKASPAYLSQHFVDTWTSAGLKGLDFECEWTEA